MLHVTCSFLLLLVCLLGLISFGFATEVIFFVDGSSTATYPNCGATTDPCATISDALRLDLTATSVVIKIAAGVYTGPSNNNLCFGYNCPGNFTLAGPPFVGPDGPGVILTPYGPEIRGLILSNKTARLNNLAFENFSYSADLATIEADGITKSFTNGGAAIFASDGVLFLESCVFTNNSAVAGGAIAAVSNGLSVRDCRFQKNKVGLFGGAILAYQGFLVVFTSRFVGNQAADYFSKALSVDGSGGAIYSTVVAETEVSITSSVFYNNTAGGNGGAVYVSTNSEIATNIYINLCEFLDNSLHGSGICLTSSTCDSNGGAIFISAYTFYILNSNFTSNLVTSSAPNVFSDGGAIYSTSRYSVSSTIGKIQRCIFINNKAESYGGAVYNINQHLLISSCTFSANIAGSTENLFADAAAAGGAIWYSAQDSENIISDTVFADNVVFGGWGGGLFCTNCKRIALARNQFLGNRVYSSYTFQAQGGAIMISFGSFANITHGIFSNNTAAPVMTSIPYTFSGSGGAIYVESATIDISYTSFADNKAITGQFDDGATGGAVLFENVDIGNIIHCSFYLNSAIGFFEYSSFASSGSGGALSLKFSSATIENSIFEGNWVSVGGTQMAIGGAVSIFFNYVDDGDATVLTLKDPIVVYNSSFVSNIAYAQLCRTASTKSGQGGAIALIGVGTPGVLIDQSTFKFNIAVSTRTGVVPSVGGGIAMTMSSVLNATNTIFFDNLALYGIGNDISSITGQQSSVSTSNKLYSQSSTFSAAVEGIVSAAAANSRHNMTTLCVETKQLKNQLSSNIPTNAALYGMQAAADASSNHQQHKPHNHHHHYHHSTMQAKIVQLEQSVASRSLLEDSFSHDASTTQVDEALDHLRELRDAFQELTQSNDKFSNQLSLTKKMVTDLENRRNDIDMSTKSLASVKSSSTTPSETNESNWKISGDFHHLQRQLRAQKSNYIKSEFTSVPSIVIAAGLAELVSPTFSGDYHIFVGNFVFVKNIYSADGSFTTAQQLLSAMKLSTNGTLLTIGGQVTQQNLSLTVLKANVQLSRFGKHDISVKEIRLWNATLQTANDLSVTGNCSLINSLLVGISRNSTANMHFNSTVLTGLGYQRSKQSFLEQFDDDAIVEEADEILTALTRMPLLTVDNAIMRIHKILRLTGDWINTISVQPDIHLRFVRTGMIVVSSAAVLEVNSPTLISSDSRIHFSLNNSGTLMLRPLNPADNNLMRIRMNQIGDPLSGESTQPSTSSPITFQGRVYQSPSGRMSITITNQNYQTTMIDFQNGGIIGGRVDASLVENTTLTLENSDAQSFATNWTLAKCGLTSFYPLVWNASVITKPAGVKLEVAPTRDKDLIVTEYLVTSNIACSDIISYYSGAAEDNLCYYCTLNTSCSYCGSTGGCVQNGQCPAGTSAWDNCCGPSGCGDGVCNPNEDHTVYSCDCNNLMIGGLTCRELSESGIAVVFVVSFAITLFAVVFYYNRYYKGQKTEILEELRQNLLTPAALNNRSVGKKSAVTKQFLDDLQQSLILKDVFVNYEEIKVESRIGEGSFGVVFKASFRGAQVALKQMRSPLFQNITSHDIEEFRKEAYMMSRLRHPNIVLVMGISLVDIEPVVGRSSSMHSMDMSNVPTSAASTFGWKKQEVQSKAQKTVCIITEFLEQGSLADILYGPTRLPEEVFTYELVLACALQAARGMLYLHSHQPPICHRDLKSSNLVVDDHWVVKVTDFGMSRIIPEKVQNQEMGLDDTGNVVPKEERDSYASSANDSAYRESEFGMPIPRESSANNFGSNRLDSSNVEPTIRVSGAALSGHRYSSFHPEMTSNLGTTAWCAPELLTASNKTRYSVKVDVYSFGMVMWELWEKKRPYEEFHSRFDITDAIRAGKRPIISDNCPPAWKSLLQRCWQAEPARRPTFKYIEKYLKDELARVRRQKGNQGGGASTYTSYGSRFSSDARSSSSGLANSLLNSNNSLGGDGDVLDLSRFKERNSSPVPIVNPIIAPEGRSPLVAFERSFSYLAKSLETGSSLSVDSFGQSPSELPTISKTNEAYGSTNTDSKTITGVRPTTEQPSHKGWRDRYVLKFSGWQQSNPDSGLPPQGAATKPMTANSNPNSNNKTVAMELRAHVAGQSPGTVNSRSASTNTNNLDSIEEMSRESTSTVNPSARESTVSVRDSIGQSAVSNPSFSVLEVSANVRQMKKMNQSKKKKQQASTDNTREDRMFAMDDDHMDNTSDDDAVSERQSTASNRPSAANADLLIRPSFGVHNASNL